MNTKEMISQGSSFSALAGQAWNALKGKWLTVIGAMLFALLIHFAVMFIPILGNLSGWLLFPLTAGVMLFVLRVVRNEPPFEISLLFQPFNQYWHYVWANLRMAIFIFLWMLLLIIPGIIAGLRYSMTVYVMLDNPQYSVKEAMAESSAIMYGHKWQYFGYSLLLGLICFAGSLFTLGFGLIWLIPWMSAFNAAFYESVRRRAPEFAADEGVEMIPALDDSELKSELNSEPSHE